MIYPANIKSKDTIGVTAISAGYDDIIDIKRYESAISNINKLGFLIEETSNVRKNSFGVSSDAKTRAKEFMYIYLNENISSVHIARGGDFAFEILDYLDFEKISQSTSKWIQGFSDTTNILFLITTICDIATIYGEHIGNYGMLPLHESLMNSILIKSGEDVIQHSFEKYQENHLNISSDNITKTFELDMDVKWKNIYNEKEIELNGRMLGGCLDVLLTLVGTKYDKVEEFLKKYESDGIVWYLESCDLSVEQLIRGLWQLKQANWFKTAKGFIFGRPGFDTSCYGIEYNDGIKRILGDLNVPIIIDACIGHKPPQLTIINGAMVNIISKESKGIVKFNKI